MLKYLFIILEAILPVLENGITKAPVSPFSPDSNISSERFVLFNSVGSNDPRVSILKVSRYSQLIRSCQSEPELCICSIGIKI